MTTILWRYAGSPAGGTASTVDAASVSSYAAAAVNWAVSDDIVAPVSDGLFAPQAAASRAQIAAAIMNLVRGSQAGPETSLSGGAKVLVPISLPPTPLSPWRNTLRMGWMPASMRSFRKRPIPRKI